MLRQGRELELLIEKLEKTVLPKGAKITSPGFIPDRITGVLREVDILIEHKVGTSQIRIIIECRDRNSIQDVTWIEQIHTKVNDIRANKVIAVSSSEYTQPAKEKAQFYGIETRIYSEINHDIIKEWWKVEYLDLRKKQFNIVSTHIDLIGSKSLDKLIPKKKTDDKFINRITDGKAFSLNDIFLGLSVKLPE
jgi:hypothetical protein